MPHVLIDVRPTEGSSTDVLTKRLQMIHAPLDELAGILRNRNSVWLTRFGTEVPGLRTTLVFISTHGHSASQAASLATSLGFSRCAVIEGGLAAATPLAPPVDRERPLLASNSAALGRDAVLLLLESGSAQGKMLITLLDVRRHDERAMYGAIHGSVNIPIDALPKVALLLYTLIVFATPHN